MADLHSKILDARPPGGPNSFNFMHFLGKFGKIVCWRPPPGELAPPPRGIPRSATVNNFVAVADAHNRYRIQSGFIYNRAKAKMKATSLGINYTVPSFAFILERFLSVM